MKNQTCNKQQTLSKLHSILDYCKNVHGYGNEDNIVEELYNVIDLDANKNELIDIIYDYFQDYEFICEYTKNLISHDKENGLIHAAWLLSDIKYTANWYRVYVDYPYRLTDVEYTDIIDCIERMIEYLS